MAEILHVAGNAVGTALFACVIATLATPLVKEFSQAVTGKVSKKEIEEVEVVDQDVYLPGQSMPNRAPDDVVKYYLNDQVEDTSYHEDADDIDTRDKDTPDEWIPRHKDLVRLTGRHPFNCEAPLTALFDKGFITPSSLHYVRNHGACPSIEWSEHTINIGGLAPKPIQLKMKDIIKLPAHSLPVTLVCCGNRRKEQNMIKQTIGFNWGAAGVSTGVWTGARLIDILKLAGD
jgi:nitrate reductase (NAD(P)H)